MADLHYGGLRIIMSYIYNRELYHYGIIGQKWGVRRYRDRYGRLIKKTTNAIDLLEHIGMVAVKTKILTAYGMTKYDQAVKKHTPRGKALAIGAMAGMANTVLQGAPYIIETGYRQYKEDR